VTIVGSKGNKEKDGKVKRDLEGSTRVQETRDAGKGGRDVQACGTRLRKRRKKKKKIRRSPGRKRRKGGRLRVTTCLKEAGKNRTGKNSHRIDSAFKLARKSEGRGGDIVGLRGTAQREESSA